MASLSALGALPPIEEAPLRERLEWEKELIGVYISEHPVARALAQLRDTVSHLCGEIGEEHHDQKVTVLGRVAAWRTTTTKKGDAMAFVTLEDVQGAIDVVVFPKTWKQTQALWQRDKIVLVRGKVDARGRKPSIICDSVSDNLNVTQPADSSMSNPSRAYTPPAPRPAMKLSESAATYSPVMSTTPTTSAPRHALPESSNIPAAPKADVAKAETLSSPAPRIPSAVLNVVRETSRPYDSPPRANGESPAVANDDRSAPTTRARSLRVTIERSSDGRADARRVGDVHRLLRSFAGSDHFTFYVTGGGNGSVELDFPNDTTLICDELLARLRSLLGPQAVHLIE
jgi:DNA polymerase-3 subunit alpha